MDAIAAEATVYLQKHSGPEELADAIHVVAQGACMYPNGQSGGCSKWSGTSFALSPKRRRTS